MNIEMENKGITLVSIIITIIILLIFVGISIGIIGSSIMDNAILVSTEMEHANIKEKIELIYSGSKVSKYNNSIFELKNEIENIEGVENVKFVENSDNTIYTEFDYCNSKYAFTISQDKIKEVDLYLKGNVKVGDYIAYPVEYDDAYSNIRYTASDGWRIIDDGVMTGTSGNVKIISSHIPVKFLYNPTEHNNNVDNVINKLTNDFENQLFVKGSSRDKIRGSYFKVNNFTQRVTTLTLSDLNNAHNAMYLTTRSSDSTSTINENDDLFAINQMAVVYWIASKQQGNDVYMYCMSENRNRK